VQADRVIHPATVSWALVYAAPCVTLGVGDSVVVRAAAKRALRRDRVDHMAVGPVEAPVCSTAARVKVDPDNARDLTEVFAEYPRDLESCRTRTVMRLFAIGTEVVSRSQARSLVSGLERFREVVLDFGGVELAGQGFADEVFRVWARQHPEVALIPIAMSPPVAFMVERAIRGASASRRDAAGQGSRVRWLSPGPLARLGCQRTVRPFQPTSKRSAVCRGPPPPGAVRAPWAW
jgi:STAS-like domain of unknown function (DUF4325)